MLGCAGPLITGGPLHFAHPQAFLLAAWKVCDRALLEIPFCGWTEILV